MVDLNKMILTIEMTEKYQGNIEIIRTI